MKVSIIIVLFAIPCAVHAATVNYTYDLAGRLTQAQYSNGASITYTYDPAGNLLSRKIVAAPQNLGQNIKPLDHVQLVKDVLDHESVIAVKQYVSKTLTRLMDSLKQAGPDKA